MSAEDFSPLPGSDMWASHVRTQLEFPFRRLGTAEPYRQFTRGQDGLPVETQAASVSASSDLSGDAYPYPYASLAAFLASNPELFAAEITETEAENSLLNEERAPTRRRETAQISAVLVILSLTFVLSLLSAKLNM